MENKPAAAIYETTRLLKPWSEGDEMALERLVPLVDAEMRRLAHHYMRRERAGHILQTTAPIKEAWLKLINWQDVSWQNRAHFIAMAAQLMRCPGRRNAVEAGTEISRRRRAGSLTNRRRDRVRKVHGSGRAGDSTSA
jgi:ECF sigma factor